MAAGHDHDRRVESQRILDRVTGQGDAVGSSMASRAARRASDHIAAKDADASDPIEYWGTRIGRILGLVLTVGVIVWLAVYLMRAG